MSGTHPRIAAISLLTRVLEHRQTLDEALSQESRFTSLEGPDRGFARAMVSATLRWLGLIDTVIVPHVTGRKFADLDPAVKQSLRIGVAQICVLETPLHAAVSETVEAVRSVEGARKAGGLINAVLRKISSDDLASIEGPADAVWSQGFQRFMQSAVGADISGKIAQAATEIPPLDITCPRDAKLWAEKIGGEQIGPVTVRLSEGNVEALPGYEAGNWWVQDVAATLPVQILSPKRAENILDMCAAPGGKTLQIAATGANVTALDRAVKRMRRVEENLKRTRLSAKCVVGDVNNWDNDAVFDGVLLDAPCSALGTLRRHPEGPWIKTRSDVERFPDIQKKLLETASKRIAEGGRLVYCVCTPIPQEGREVVESFLAVNPEWRRDEILPAEVPGFEGAITEANDILTLPGTFNEPGGCDIFFIARLRRA